MRSVSRSSRAPSLVLVLVAIAAATLAGGCRSIEVGDATTEVVLRGAGRAPRRVRDLVVTGFHRTRRVTHVSPSVGFGIGVGSGGASFGPSIGVSRQSVEVPVDDVRHLVADVLRSRAMPASLHVVDRRRRVGSGRLELQGLLDLDYENQFLNGAYRVLITLVPLIFVGVPLHENGVVGLTASLWDERGELLVRTYSSVPYALWANIYEDDEAEEEARVAAISVAVEAMADEIAQALEEP